MLTSKPKQRLRRMLPESESEDLQQLELKAMPADAESQLKYAEAPPRWVRLIREDVESLPEEMRVQDIVQLRRLLRRAILVEHTTIPPYLTALYSLQEGTNLESVQVIRSVLVEEMLHMILAANVLNAIGGEPSVNDPRFIPSYPSNLLGLLNTRSAMNDATLDDLLKIDAQSAQKLSGMKGAQATLEVGIEKFSPDTIDVFLEIESPVPVGGEGSGNPTIGSFYKIIIDGLERLEAEARAEGKSIFDNSPERQQRQIHPEHYYGSGGQAIVVTNLRTARKALKEIVFQGEGFDPRFFDKAVSIGSYDEIGHYYRFNEIKQGRYYEEGDTPETGPTGATLRVDWSKVYPMKPTPTLNDYRESAELQRLGKAFNQGYMRLLDKMQVAFTGEPDALQEAVVFMFELKYLAVELLKNPLPSSGFNAGPIFGYLGETD